MATLAKNDTLSSSGGNNFKGVMLCHRPCKVKYVPASVDSQNIRSSHGGSFICRTVKKPWGRNVVISEKARVLCRLPHKESALSKHKKWLSDLQKERENCQLNEMEEQIAKDTRMRQFKEREARKRERVLSSVGDDMRIEAEGEASTLVELKETEEQASLRLARCSDEEVTEIKFHPSKRKTKNNRRDNEGNVLLPAWAMTESKTERLEAEAVEMEHDELLSFVDGLDYEKFESDIELGLLMNKVKERIKVLEKERQKEEATLRRIEESENAAKSTEFNNVYMFNSSEAADSIDPNFKNGDDDDIQSIAGTVISGKNGLMGYIHSRKSAGALVQLAKERLDTDKLIGISSSSLEQIAEENGDLVEERKRSPPTSITHKDDEGARLAVMKSLQKLPFMNRNPAV